MKLYQTRASHGLESSYYKLDNSVQTLIPNHNCMDCLFCHIFLATKFQFHPPPISTSPLEI